MTSKLQRPVLSLACALLATGPVFGAAAPSAEERNLTELRNTVVNLLQALVEKGVLTREQAQQMVQNAQNKADADLTARAEQDKAQEKADEGAVRVPYIPEVVKEEIRKEVVADLTPAVTKEVVAQVNSASTLSEALPEWVRRMHWSSDVRLREEGDQFGKDNATNTYLDFLQVNSKGGAIKAGPSGLLNTTEDRDRLRVRLRLGFDADLGSGWTAGARLATGTGEVYATTNQTLGTYGQRYQIATDLAYVRWTGETASGHQMFTTVGGRFANPYLGTDLVWYNDLTFEGIASTYRLNFSSDRDTHHYVYLTGGAFPLQDVTPSSHDKWLAGGQLGVDFGSPGQTRLRVGASYYDYIHIVGQRNAPDGSTLLDYTAPPLLQKGNTLYDIRNDNDPSTNLYALAADYKIADVLAVADWRVLNGYTVSLTGEYLKNVGFKADEVAARIGQHVDARTRGYRADLAFGSNQLREFGSWRAAFGYRYLERDAVLDAFNDQDFHLGGTDAKGFTVTLDYAFNPRVSARLRYLSANAIDGPPLDIDVWQLDVNTSF